MAIGYAALSQLLTINGTANISANWDVKISNIAEGTLTGATSKNVATVSGDKLAATFDNSNYNFKLCTSTLENLFWTPFH